MVNRKVNRARYEADWRGHFLALCEPYLRPGITILDIGSGRTPLFAPSERPPGCRYVGLDISEEELQRAPKDSYDETVVSDLTVTQDSMLGKADLIVSWQVLEHVADLTSAIENSRKYLKPGGAFVALCSGKNAHFSLLNRIIPAPVGKFAMKKLLNRPPDTVFHAFYDHCTYDNIVAQMKVWQFSRIHCMYRGAGYFAFSGLLQRAYLVYEDWADRKGRLNLATHYVIEATR